MRSTIITLLALASQAVTQTAVSVGTFNTIARYTQFAAASYANKCNVAPFGSSVVGYYQNTAFDAQATLFRDDAAKEFILSFRGTSTPQDYSTDLQLTQVPLTASGTNCAACTVHQGFQESFNALSDTVFQAVSYQLFFKGDYKLILTGHSLGGAIASIAASSFTARGRKVSSVYTFGEPRNGNPAFTTYINGQVAPANYFRVTHANDGVPQVLNANLGYQAHGTEYWQSLNGTANTAASTFQCPGVDPTDCNAKTGFGDSFINGAHLIYSNQLIGNSLFVTGCGAKYP